MSLVLSWSILSLKYSMLRNPLARCVRQAAQQAQIADSIESWPARPPASRSLIKQYPCTHFFLPDSAGSFGIRSSAQVSLIKVDARAHVLDR